MTRDEYVLGLLAIISGLAITHMVASLFRLLEARRRVQFDWLALTSAAFVAYMVLYGWWISWSAFTAHVGPLPFWAFILPVVSLTIAFMSARAIIPEEIPVEGLDLRAHYARVAPWVWRAQVACALIVIMGVGVRLVLMQSASLGNAAPWGIAGQAAHLLLMAVLAIVASRRVHVVVVPSAFAVFVAATIMRTI